MNIKNLARATVLLTSILAASVAYTGSPKPETAIEAIEAFSKQLHCERASSDILCENVTMHLATLFREFCQETKNDPSECVSAEAQDFNDWLTQRKN